MGAGAPAARAAASQQPARSPLGGTSRWRRFTGTLTPCCAWRGRPTARCWHLVRPLAPESRITFCMYLLDTEWRVAPCWIVDVLQSLLFDIS